MLCFGLVLRRSTVDVGHDIVERAADCDKVGDFLSSGDVVDHTSLRQAGRCYLEAVGLCRAVAFEVEAKGAAATLGELEPAADREFEELGDFDAVFSVGYVVDKLCEYLGRFFGEVKAAGFNTKPGEGYSYVCQTLDMGISYYRLVYARLTGEPFVVAETKNLLIREMTTKDLPELYAVYSTLEDCQYIEQLYDYDKELEFTKNYIKNMYGFFEYGLWLVFEKKSGELIGRAGIENREIDGVTCREIGYLIRRDMQHKGYAYEACQAILEYASDELGIQEMFAVIDKTNEPSRKLAQKLGFELYAQTDGGPDLYKFVFG